MRSVITGFGLVAAVVGPAAVAAALAAAPDAPGVYLGRGEGAVMICPLTAVELSDLPAVVVEGQPAVPAEDVEFSFRAGAAAEEAGVRLGGVRLLRVEPGDPRPSMRVIAVAPERDAEDRGVFRLQVKQLTPGRYVFAVEHPGWEAGLDPGERVLRFLGCGFRVDGATADSRGDGSQGPGAGSDRR